MNLAVNSEGISVACSFQYTISWIIVHFRTTWQANIATTKRLKSLLHCVREYRIQKIFHVSHSHVSYNRFYLHDIT